MPRRSFGEKLTRTLIQAIISLVFIVAALWFGLYILPDMLTEMFTDAINAPNR